MYTAFGVDAFGGGPRGGGGARGNGDAHRVVPLAAARLSSSAASPLLAPADRAAVAAAVRCVEEVRAASRRNPGSRLLAAAGLVGAGGGFEGGALLQALRVEGQKKTRPAADGGSASPARGPSEQHTPDDDVLEASRTVRGEASKAFFAECAARRFPRRLEPTPAGARRRGPRRASVGACTRGTRAGPGERRRREREASARPTIRSAIRPFAARFARSSARTSSLWWTSARLARIARGRFWSAPSPR